MKNNMYSGRVCNIPVQRGCSYSCTYCYAVNSTWVRTAKCQMCKDFQPHAHLEALRKKPPKTTGDEFITVGLGGDISFAEDTTMQAIIHYCHQYKDTTFLLQSKNPGFFLQYHFPYNVILGTTLETNRDTAKYSKAPSPLNRIAAMRELRHRCPNRRTITIEPLMCFDKEIFVEKIRAIAPWKIWIGLDNHDAKLPEPCLGETAELIEELRTFTTVIEKTIRKPWNNCQEKR